MELENKTKEQVARFLPEAIQKAFRSYYAYADSDWRGQGGADKPVSKLFADHHMACKAALSHIELLLKLGKMTDADVRADHTHFALVQHQVREEIDAYYAQEALDGDESTV